MNVRSESARALIETLCIWINTGVIGAVRMSCSSGQVNLVFRTATCKSRSLDLNSRPTDRSGDYGFGMRHPAGDRSLKHSKQYDTKNRQSSTTRTIIQRAPLPFRSHVSCLVTSAIVAGLHSLPNLLGFQSSIIIAIVESQRGHDQARNVC